MIWENESRGTAMKFGIGEEKQRPAHVKDALEALLHLEAGDLLWVIRCVLARRPELGRHLASPSSQVSNADGSSLQLRRHRSVAPKVLLLLERLRVRCLQQVVLDSWERQCAERGHRREQRKLLVELHNGRLRHFEATLARRLGEEQLLLTQVFLGWRSHFRDYKFNEILSKQAVCHEAAMDSLLAAACAPAMDSLLTVAEYTRVGFSGVHSAISGDRISGDHSSFFDVERRLNTGEVSQNASLSIDRKQLAEGPDEDPVTLPSTPVSDATRPQGDSSGFTPQPRVPIDHLAVMRARYASPRLHPSAHGKVGAYFQSPQMTTSDPG